MAHELSAHKIRQKFIDFFAQRGHASVASDSVVPKDDPTVLFTTAGMQQFKRQFLGYTEDYTRAVSCQKCIRTDDLDEVGRTAFHHTFFEMLGNFSFGDYFKTEAIQWAWEFLTKELSIPPENLWVSVYHEDREAEDVWIKTVGLPRHRVVRLGDKSNFWPANAKQDGPNGPCGPCSEIFYDYGVNPECGENCNPDCDCGRFSEVWNLVFTQFNRKDDGSLDPLPAKNIDTGMGLERLTAVIQGKRNNFDTDLFVPILESIDRDMEHARHIDDTGKRIIADHIRAVVFAIADGVIPSNKERGSVVKRLITDSCNIVLRHSGSEPSIYRIVPTVIETMRTPYPELADKGEMITDLVKKTEAAFIRVREQRIPELKQLPLTRMSSEQRGETYFKYRDTFGLPLTTILDTASSQGVTPQQQTEDLKFYEACMARQKNRSRQASKMAGDVFLDQALHHDLTPTTFIGYDNLTGTARLLRLLRNGEPVEQAAQGEQIEFILDQTPFYAEAGGQIGDTGWLRTNGADVRILDTQKQNNIYFHRGRVEKGTVARGETVTLSVEEDRRLAIMRNHTATHLLQAALRTVLGTHVQQQGSLVAEDRLRFDFTHPQAVSEKEKIAIEDYVNTAILRCLPVHKDILPLDEARKSGALAFFAEKYGKEVRVVSIDDVSKEFCGGTHLQTTGQIGFFKIVGESSIAQGIRRLEAKTGTLAYRLIREQEQQLTAISRLLKSTPDELVDRVKTQTQTIKSLQKKVDDYKLASLKENIASLLEDARDIDGVKLVAHTFSNLDMPGLRKVSDQIKHKAASAVIFLGSSKNSSAYLLASVTDDQVKRGIHADALIREVAPIIHGQGGGRPNLAQAGSKEPGSVPQAVETARQLIVERLSA